MEPVMADGGQGLERGVKLAHEARSEAQEPETDSPAAMTLGLDVFHPQREWERVIQRQWNRVAAPPTKFCGRLCPQWQEGYVKVDELLRQAVGARSAVEGVKSRVRMHQGRHRHVRQGMLDLKRLYENCRVFEGGKRKGSCPDELLGLKLPTSDGWQRLQMDPNELEQKWLTQ